MASYGYLTKRLTAPSVQAVTLEEAKEQLVIDHSDDDVLLTRLISAAVSHVESVTGLSLVRQQWRRYLDGLCDEMYLPRGPVQSIAQVQYIDSYGATQTLSTSVYELDPAYPRLLRAYGQTWPGTQLKRNAVWIDYWAGYFDNSVSPIPSLTTAIPENLRHAVLLMAGDLYTHRERQLDMELYQNPAFDLLLAPYRIYLQ